MAHGAVRDCVGLLITKSIVTAEQTNILICKSTLKTELSCLFSNMSSSCPAQFRKNTPIYVVVMVVVAVLHDSLNTDVWQAAAYARHTIPCWIMTEAGSEVCLVTRVPIFSIPYALTIATKVFHFNRLRVSLLSIFHIIVDTLYLRKVHSIIQSFLLNQLQK